MELSALSHPERIWWLLLLPVLYLLALPPRPRKLLLTAHWHQWLRAQARLRRRPVRFRRLRFLLLVLAFVFAVLAHAGPALGGTPGPERLLVLLDRSASMGATPAEGGAVWPRVLAQVRGTLEALPDHVPVRVALCGPTVRVLTGAAARGLVGAGEPAGAVELSWQALHDRLSEPAAAVWTVTDGFGPARPPPLGALTLVGAPVDNVAVLEASLEDSWPLGELRVTVVVGSLATGPVEVALAVQGAVEPIEPRMLRLQPGAREEVELELVRLPAGGVLEVTASAPGDGLAIDDVAAWHLPPLPAPDVAVLPADAEEAGPAIGVAAEVLAAETGGAVVDAGAGSAGFLLVEGGVVDLPPRARAIAFGVRSSTGAEPEVIPFPRVVDWDRVDPLTAGLDLSELRVDHALRGALPTGRAVLWGAGGGGDREPLAVVAGTGDAASIHLAFRLADSNFALLPAFPQFLRRALVVAYGAGARSRWIGANPRSILESDLRERPSAPDRELPVFARPGASLAPWLLALAALLLALRVYVR